MYLMKRRFDYTVLSICLPLFSYSISKHFHQWNALRSLSSYSYFHSTSISIVECVPLVYPLSLDNLKDLKKARCPGCRTHFQKYVPVDMSSLGNIWAMTSEWFYCAYNMRYKKNKKRNNQLLKKINVTFLQCDKIMTKMWGKNQAN